MTRSKHVFYPEDSKGIFVFLLMTKHSGRQRLLLFLLCLPYACNYKTPRAPRAAYCSFSSSLLWPESDASADMFIVGAVRGPSIHSTLCSSCLFDRVMLGFHLRARRRQDCNYQDWSLAELEGHDVSLHKHGGCKRAGVETRALT